MPETDQLEVTREDLEGSIFLPENVTDTLAGIESRGELDRVVFAHWLARGAFAGLSHDQRLVVESKLSILRQRFDAVCRVSGIHIVK